MNINTNYVPVAGTFSKDSRFFGGRFPFHYVESASGCQIKGDNGKWYIDWISGLGASLVGYGHNDLTAYVAQCLAKGNGLSLPSYLEYQAAEKLCKLLNDHVTYWTSVPLQVRWVNTGSDACNAAIRLARAVTGKTVIANSGYRGWSDQFVSATPPAWGIPREYEQNIMPFNFGEMPPDAPSYAAVILEQPLGTPPKGYYQQLRGFCDNHKCLLIIDEVVTGLRYALGGVSELYGIQPDLMCLGKALSAGQPLAALVGPTDYLQWFARTDPVFVSGTNAGNVGGLAAADWLLSQFDENDVAYLWHIGKRLIEKMSAAGAPIHGDAVRSIFTFNNDYEKAYFIWQMAENGIIMNRPNFPTLAHTENIVDSTAYAAQRVMRDIQSYGQEALEIIVGKANLPVVLFRNR